ncbi:MAG TPA: transglutaminase domain-containing protein [Gaiellaceae bacterium]|nr:transglutaminase domain-containing protein [Gaiellaceae bacterium]
MNKSAVIAAVTAWALVVVAQAGATATHPSPHRTQAQIARLTKLNRQLHTRLRNMTVDRNEKKAALDAANAQISSLQTQAAGLRTQAASLQASLQQRTAERDAALAKVTSLQAQIAAVPTPLAVAVERVRRDVAYQEQQGLLPYSHGRLVSQAAMDYVVGHVSASAYGYLEVFGGGLPAATPDAVLAAQAGICGDAALTYAAIVKRFGFQVRSAQFFYTDPPPWSTPDSHIAVEVFYDGGWHLFDPTFGTYYQDAGENVLSITDVRANGGTQVKDEASFTNLAENHLYGDSTAFETDPATVVTLGQQPFTG